MTRRPPKAPAMDRPSAIRIQVPGSGTVAYTWAAPVAVEWDQVVKLVE